jgi:hypothetical protein
MLQLTTGYPPQFDGIIRPARSQQLPIRAEGKEKDISLFSESLPELAGSNLVQVYLYLAIG